MADNGVDVFVGELVSDRVMGHEAAAGYDGCGQGAAGVRGGGEPRSCFEGVEAEVLGAVPRRTWVRVTVLCPYLCHAKGFVTSGIASVPRWFVPGGCSLG